jgi:hypothetical protein
MVAKALGHLQWVHDITGSLSMPALAQYLTLWAKLQQIHLSSSVDDRFIWKWSARQCYSASLAYKAFFQGQCGVPGAKVLCKARAPPQCKFFIWLSLLDRCWTPARLQRHCLPNNGPCVLCAQEEESIDHLVSHLQVSRTQTHLHVS